MTTTGPGPESPGQGPRGSAESAAAAGIVFSISSVLALGLLRGRPFHLDSQVGHWRSDEASTPTLLLGLSLASIAAVALLWFVAVVRRRVGKQEDQFFSTVFLGSAIVYACLWLVGTTHLAAPALLAEGELSPEVIKLSEAIATGLLLVVGTRIQAVFVASVSTILLKTQVLPQWVAYLGYMVALVLFVVPFVSSPLGLAMPIFVFVTSVMMLTRRVERHSHTSVGSH